MLGVVRQIRKHSFIYVEHPYVLALSGDVEALRVERSLVGHHLGVVAIAVPEHVVSHVVLARKGHGRPTANVVGLDAEPPALAGDAMQVMVVTGSIDLPEGLNWKGQPRVRGVGSCKDC